MRGRREQGSTVHRGVVSCCGGFGLLLQAVGPPGWRAASKPRGMPPVPCASRRHVHAGAARHHMNLQQLFARRACL